ncbi:MAG TPA: hypothetical protein VG797_01255 [Phycisphaerales bacterium]|nr:hypothetical protein [Phycisphaerales bacterium]
MKSWMKFAALSMLVAGLTVPASIGLGAEETNAPAKKADAAPASAPEKKTRDILILKSGKTVEGKILEETATTVKFEVRLGGIKAPTTYEKTDILEVKRGVADDSPEIATKATSTSGSSRAKEKEKDRAPTGDENAKKIYLVELKGKWGQDVSETPLAKVMEDVERVNPDIVVVKIKSGSQLQDEEIAEDDFDNLFRTEKMAPVFEKAMIEKGRRVVFWVDIAQGGAAFLPFVSPEIYFTSEGWLGGIGDLGDFNIGDHMVNEKQISLRLGHAEGFFIKGGYAPELVRAMSRADYWMYVRFSGGKPEYYMDRELTQAEVTDGGWTMLSDDGKGPHKDKTRVGGLGDDTLTLHSEMALRLGVSKGTTDSMDELADKLGIGTNYLVLKDKETRGPQILKDWRDDIADAVSKINTRGRPGKLVRELHEIPEGGSSIDEVKKNLGRRMSLLKQIRGIIASYAEVFDPSGASRARLDVQIEELKQKIAQATRLEQQQQQSNGRK